MIDNYKKLLDEKIALAKKVGNPTDATPILQFIVEHGHKFSDKERKSLVEALQKSFREVGQVLLDRALSDSTLSDKEWKEYMDLGLTEGQMSTVLQGYYNKKDGLLDMEEHGDVVIMTTQDSLIYKHKKMLEAKFEIKIMNQFELMKMMEKGVSE